MLKKILTIAFVIALLFSFGCKNTNTETKTKNTVSTKQSVKDGKTTTETVKKQTVKETETLVKDANAQVK